MVTDLQDINKTWRITGWQNGIGPSPISGFFDMRNMNISTSPGLGKINFELLRYTIPVYSSTPTVTANTGTDVLTASFNLEQNSNSLITNQPFTLTTTGTLPAPLATSTIYYAIRLSATTFKVATTLANANSATAIDITTTGTGVHSFQLLRPARITNFVQKPGSYIFALDETGRLWFDDLNGGTQWYLLDGNTRTSANGDGLVYWKNYVFVFRNTKIDVLDVSALPAYTITWTNDWQTIFSNATSGRHYGLVAQDNIIYFTNGVDTGASLDKWFVGSIKENVAPFAPGTAGSYTFNGKALDLPKAPTTLCELGINLLVGTVGREIYPWDRVSPSFKIPIVVNEVNTYCMVNRNNVAYIFAGQSGTIYSTTGSSTDIIARIPDTLTGYFYTTQNNIVYYYQAIPLGQKILFALKTATEGYVCSLDPVNSNAVTIENTYSIGSTTIQDIGALFQKSAKQYFASWETSSDASTDYNTPYVCDNYEAYCTTEFFSPGTVQEQATLNQIELSLIKPLTSGQAVRLSYRLSLADSFTTLVDITNTAYPGIQNIILTASDVPGIGVGGIIDIQIKIEFDAASSSTATPECDYIDLKFA